MHERLEKFKGWGSATLNKLKVVGPFLVSQSDRMSEMWQEHQRRLATVRIEEEAGKSEVKIKEETRLAEVAVFQAAAAVEMAARVELRQKLLERAIDAPLEERIEIERKLEFLDDSTRILGIAAKATDYQKPSASDSGKEIEGHWIDTFNDLARKRNEDWRNDLLARALAKEAEAPGSVSPRALWTIGNFDQAAFDNFAEILDLCVWPVTGSEAFIPQTNVAVYKRTTVSGKAISKVVFQISDLGLLGDASAYRELNPAFVSILRYGNDGMVINPKVPFKLTGLFLSPLGSSIARFYKKRWNDQGRQVFHDLKQWIKPTNADVVELDLSNFDADGED